MGMGLFFGIPTEVSAQQLFTANDPLSGSQLSAPRTLNYWPEGEDFVTVNGHNRFTRALYGANTGFRVETSDYPEFALYMPQMGGNVLLSLVRPTQTGEEVLPLTPDAYLPPKSTLSSANVRVECRYRPGRRIYHIQLPQEWARSNKKDADLEITVLAAYDGDRAVWQIASSGVAADVQLLVRFGAATNDRFSREGDMGVDKKDCFDFTAARCRDNKYTLTNTKRKTSFELKYGARSKRGERTLGGFFSAGTQCRVVHPEGASEGEALEARMPLATRGKEQRHYGYFALGQGADGLNDDSFAQAVRAADSVASSIRIETPDPFLNTLGGAMATAADAIWGEEGVWLHGSIGWRMPLCGWRAAYTGDVVGQHDRAHTHFLNYAASQLTDVPPVYAQPMQDSSKNLARGLEKFGTPIYSNGYICRMPNSTTKLNHYDMNLVYIDELLWHFNWTGSLDDVLNLWPVLTRHLAWEKRNFDPNDDGLYDAYCCIWASDALYYSGGSVTHSSAYNYRAHLKTAMIARLLQAAADAGRIPQLSELSGVGDAFVGFDSYAAQAEAYQSEADKILAALNSRLWLPDRGVWAEYQDALGLQRTHPQAALWTIYHAIDSETATPRQAYAATSYVDRELPHFPLRVQIPEEGESQRTQYAANIAVGNYATVATTNWQPYEWSINNVALAEVSHTALAYWQAGRNDAAFHLMKSALLDAMYLGASPGNFGQISYYDAARSECYRDFGDPVGITCRTLVQGLFGIRPDRLNQRLYIEPGFPSSWDHAAIETPDYALSFHIDTVRAEQGRDGHLRSVYTYRCIPEFGTDTLIFRLPAQAAEVTAVGVQHGSDFDGNACISYLDESVETPRIEIRVLARPQHGTTANGTSATDHSEWVLTVDWSNETIDSEHAGTGERSDDGFFERCRQGKCSWWQPTEALLKMPTRQVDLGSITPGDFDEVDSTRLEMVDLTSSFNERVTELFHQKYLSPRASQTTLALPTQGYGEWCHPLDTVAVDDRYLRACGAQYGYLPTSLHVPFRTPASGDNIIFTSQWDNFPTQVQVPLQGKASHLYLLMTGTTNAMQSRIANGVLRVAYADGSSDTLNLVNPETWWPIEQDYLDGTPAFYLNHRAPYRQCLASPELYRPDAHTLNHRIEGGATILLDLPVAADKDLRYLEVATLSNDVVIGLMSITLQR
jgi:hypothetical protein